MQENRSFDSYFGTYPGSGRDPDEERHARPCACPNPAGGCTRPYHDTADVERRRPARRGNAVADVDGGKMDGFIGQRDAAKATLHQSR